jgi:hypothetical protein
MLTIKTFRQTPAPERLPRTKAASYISTYLSAGRELWKLSLLQAQADLEKDMARQKFLQSYILDLEKAKAQLQKSSLEQGVKVDLAEFDAQTQAVRDESKFLRERELQFAKDQGLSARQAASDQAAAQRAAMREAGMDRRLGTITGDPAFAKDPNESIVQQVYGSYAQDRNPIAALAGLDAQLKSNPSVNRAEADISVYKLLEGIARDKGKDPMALAVELAAAVTPGSPEALALAAAIEGQDLAALKAAGGRSRTAPTSSAPQAAASSAVTGAVPGRAQSVRAAAPEAPELPAAPARPDISPEMQRLEATRAALMAQLGEGSDTDLIGKAREIFGGAQFFPSAEKKLSRAEQSPPTKLSTQSVDYRKAEAQRLAEEFIDSFGQKDKRPKPDESLFKTSSTQDSAHLKMLLDLYEKSGGQIDAIGPEFGKHLVKSGVDRTSDQYSRLMASHLIMSEMYGTPDFEDLKREYFIGLKVDQPVAQPPSAAPLSPTPPSPPSRPLVDTRSRPDPFVEYRKR